MASFNRNNTVISAYLTTNANNPQNPGSLISTRTNDGRFTQDFTAMQTTLRTMLGSNFAAEISEGETYFVQKEIFTDPSKQPYEILFGIRTASGDFNTTTPLVFPQNANLAAQPAIDIVGSLYQIVQPVYGGEALYIVPKTGAAPTDLQKPQQIFVYINCNLAVEIDQFGPTLQKYFLMAYSIDNTIFPSMPTDAIQITLPSWIDRPYWAHQIFSLQNKKITEIATAKGGWPTATATLKSFFFENDQAKLPSVGETEGLPFAFMQVECDALDVSYIGNSSSGQILSIGIFEPPQPNVYVFKKEPSFYEQTKQKATNLTGKSNIQFTILDKSGQPYLSLLALYDVTVHVRISATRQ